MYFSDFWMAGAGRATAVTPARSPAIRDAEPGHRDADLVRRNGDALPVSMRATALGVAGGERLVSFISREELDRLNEALLHAQRLAGIGTLTASVAHELTNPISIITATCTNLLDELGEESISRDDLVRYIELIEHSAFRCARIVEVLRNYAHNVGRQAGEGAAIAITSPEAVVQDALTMVEQQFRKQARVTVEVDLDPDLPTVFCDHHRITQVLINLLLNARDAMQPEGGVIRVRFWSPDPALAARAQLPERPAANGQNGADLFAFSVTDMGTGIDPAVLPRIFDPFFTTKPNGQGTGLGLFIAQGIIRQHGGDIWAENNPGGGATVTVVLPRKQ